jgi:hypothetical protein
MLGATETTKDKGPGVVAFDGIVIVIEVSLHEFMVSGTSLSST